MGLYTEFQGNSWQSERIVKRKHRVYAVLQSSGVRRVRPMGLSDRPDMRWNCREAISLRIWYESG
jgi:hypothetical protein